MSAVIKNREGKKCYKIYGKYTEELIAEDLHTGNKWMIFKAPPKPKNHDDFFGMNLYGL